MAPTPVALKQAWQWNLAYKHRALAPFALGGGTVSNDEWLTPLHYSSATIHGPT